MDSTERTILRLDRNYSPLLVASPDYGHDDTVRRRLRCDSTRPISLRLERLQDTLSSSSRFNPSPPPAPSPLPHV
jgi:hypothetical protein